MLFFFKIFVLVGLIKLLLATENPTLCAGLYAGLASIINLMFGVPLMAVAIVGLIAFALAFGYFWLLNRLDGSSLFWLVLAIGLLIGIV